MIGYPLDSHVEFDPDGTPIFDRAISSAPLRKLYKSLFSDGILPNPSTNLQVSTGEGMNVIVSPGFALCNGCMKLEEAQRTLAVQASSAAYDRIDTVVLRLNDNDADRICDLYIIQGIPAVSPVRPELTRTESIWELGLADLFIAKNSTVISNQRITDTRYETPRCGVMSSISRFDTEKLYQQVQSDLSDFRANEQAAFVAWFEAIRDQLSTDAAGNLFEMIQNLKKEIDEKDISNNTVEFDSGDDADPKEYTEVEVIKSGDLFKSILTKATTMIKNVRYIWRMLGETDISKIGDGTVTGAIGAINDNLSQANTKTYGVKRSLTTNDDLNDITEIGLYYYANANVPKNAPFSRAAIVEVCGSHEGASALLQRVTTYSGSAGMAYRTLNAGSFSAWREVSVTTML